MTIYSKLIIISNLLIYSAISLVSFIHFNEIKESSTSTLSNSERESWEFIRLRDPKTNQIPENIKQREYEFVSKMPINGKLDSKSNKIQSLNTWTQRGPAQIGGRTRALAIDVKNENRILAGGVDGGLWISNDAGLTWTQKTLSEQIHSITCIVQDTRQGKENIWYYGTGERLGSRSLGNGVFKSTDNGETWTQLQATIKGSPSSFDNEFDFTYNIVVNPKAPNNIDEVLVATADGCIFRSTDGGISWKNVLGSFGTNSLNTDIAVNSSGVYYATMSQEAAGNRTSSTKGIFRSADGVNWTNIIPQDFPSKYGRFVIAIDPKNENTIYFFGETPNSGFLTLNNTGDSLWHSFYKYTYISGNGAGSNGTWENRSQNLPIDKVYRRASLNSQSGYDMFLRVHPSNSNIVFLGATNVYRSIDAFATPSAEHIGGYCHYGNCDYDYLYPNHHPDMHNMLFLPSNPNIVLTASDGGIHKTNDVLAKDVTWISLNNKYYTTQFYCVGIDKSTIGNEAIVGGMQDNASFYSNKNDNKAWQYLISGDGFNCDMANGGKFVISSKNKEEQPKIHVYKSDISDNGTVINTRRIDPYGAKDMPWATPFKLDPNNSNILYLGCGNLLFRNNNLSLIPMNGAKDSVSIAWDSLSFTSLNNKSSQLSYVEAISSVSVSSNPANIVYYGTNYGRVFRLENANQGNPKPTEITSKLFPNNANVGCISIDPSDANKIIVCFTNYNVRSIFSSNDAGATWIEVSGNLEENPYSIDGSGAGPAILWIEIIQVGGKKAYLAATTAGLFITCYLNGSATVWLKEGLEAIGNTYISMITSRNADAYVAVASYGTGIFQTYLKNLPEIPQKSNLVYPLNLSKGIKDSVNLSWQSSKDAYYYKYQLSKDSTFKTIDFENNGSKLNYVFLNTLEAGYKDYFWRVAGIGAGGVSNFSDVWKFRTMIGSTTVTYPQNSAINIAIPLELTWAKIEGATSYDIQVSKNSFYSAIVADKKNVTGTKLLLDSLEAEKKYFVRIKANDEVGSGSYCPNISFTTAAKSSVGSNDEIKFQIYPNPSNDYVNIEFNSNSNQKLEIKLFDIKGNLVKQQYQILNEGFCKLNFETKTINNGKYYLQMILNNKEYYKIIDIIR